MASSSGDPATSKASIEEEDLLQRSTRCCKVRHDPPDPSRGDLGQTSENPKGERTSYRDMARGDRGKEQELEEEVDDEGNTSDNNLVEEGDGVTWFGMGMTKMEKFEARQHGGTI